MLLSHTPGLSQGGFAGYTHNPPPLSIILQGLHPSNLSQVYLEGLPGQRFQYSGGGFTILQMVLETVLEKSFPTIIQRLVFDPLNMRRSRYVLDPASESNFAGAYATGQTAHVPPYHHFPELAAAGLWTTSSELLLVIRALQSSLEGTNDAFLKREWARLMLTVVQSRMARGWVASASSGVFGHAGSNDPGYHCLLVGWGRIVSQDNLFLDNAEGGGICVMTNSQLGYEVAKKIVHATSYLMGWPEFPAAYATNTGVIPFTATGPIKEGWQDWKGYWGEKWHLLVHAEIRLPPCCKAASGSDIVEQEWRGHFYPSRGGGLGNHVELESN
ncbi:hypothetical protein MMC13_006793 [Lambiella insularis]|nr:hypothetical protein [Lambiella insularis]